MTQLTLSAEGGVRGERTLFRMYIMGYQVRLYQKSHKITQENCINLEISIYIYIYKYIYTSKYLKSDLLREQRVAMTHT